MAHIAIIGAGISGVTTAYALLDLGFEVTVFDRHRYAAMETSFANGGQLSASNAEVWNSWPTVFKGLRWMFRRDAPLLINPRPSWHKYSWMGEFVAAIPKHRANTIATTRLAIAARSALLSMAAREGIDFDLQQRGILHVYRDEQSFRSASSVNTMLVEGGLDRRPVSPDEMSDIEPTLAGAYFGGFFTQSDSTGDIHKFTQGLARACKSRGATFIHDATVTDVAKDPSGGAVIHWRPTSVHDTTLHNANFEGVVVCAGIRSRQIARMLGDRVNVYPVKGYSITVMMENDASRAGAPWVSLLDDAAKIVTSRLGPDRFRVAGTAEFNGENLDIRADRIRPLVDWTRRLFPNIDTRHVVPWSGLRPMMPDMLPHVAAGRHPGVFYNTGHGHLGWTLSGATAGIVADLVAAQFQNSRARAASIRTGALSRAAA
jgi:D-amino-acid dehydrogenase